MIFLVWLAALILPLVLIPVEKIIPYPYIVEEIIKAILILIILKIPKFKNQTALISTIIMAFLFAFSENIFYSTNFIANSLPFSIFWQRFILTTIFHISTAMIIFLSSKKRLKMILPATILVIIIHYFYNQII